jgi:hypothetical protein
MSESTETERVWPLETELAWAFFMRGKPWKSIPRRTGCQLAMAESLAFARIAFA